METIARLGIALVVSLTVRGLFASVLHGSAVWTRGAQHMC